MSRKLGDKVTTLLATFFVVGGGLVSCTFIVLTTADNVGKPLLIGCGSVAAIALLLLWLQHDKGDQEVTGKKFFWKLAEKQQTRKSTYKIKLRGHSDAKKIRPNRPPTVKTIQELSDGQHNWVPSDRRPKRNKPG